MKPILRGVAFTAAILSLALGSGCRGQKANATEIPTVSNPAPVTVAAPASASTAPAVVVVPAAPVASAPSAPVTTSAVLPGSIIITNSAPAVSAPSSATLGSAQPVPADTNVVLEATPPVELNLSPALAEVVKLVQAGVSEEVLMAYVTNSADYFGMGSGEILYLRDLGVADNLITTLITQDATPQALAAKKAAAAVNPLPPGLALNTPATNIYPPTTAQLPATVLEATNTATGTLPPAVVYTVPAATQPVTVNYFYNELAPYGTWIDVPGYGHCWRPTVSVWNRGWRPYADGGRWLWTDSGWYWYSDYSWGWAPFHYGRWTTHGHYGWVWVPDVHWGPAWVSWRSSSSYCGWAPLPPSAYWAGHGFRHHSLSVGINFEFGLSDFHYVYLPFNRFCDRRPSHYYVTSHRAREIHRETTVVNNYVTVNNTVVNRGVGYDRVAAVNRDTIRRVSLRPTSDTPRGSTRREVLDTDGRTLTVARPVNVGFVSGNGAAPRSTPSAPGVRPPSGGRAGTGTLGSAPRETTPSVPSTPTTPRVDAPRGPRPAPTVTRSATRSASDAAPVTSVRSTPSMVTTPSTGGGRTVPAAPTTPSAEAPRGGRNAARPNTSQTQARVAPEVRTATPAPAAPVVRVPPSTPAPRAETSTRVYVQPQPSRSESPRVSAPNPSFNNAPRTPSYSAPAPAPTPRVEAPRAPSPAPSVQRSAPSVERSAPGPSSPRPAPSQAPSRSGGDGGSRSSRDDNGRRNSR